MRNKLTALLVATLVLGAPSLLRADWETGVAAFKSGNYTAAAQEFQTITEQHKDWPDGYFMLGQALNKLNRKQDALNAFRQAYDLKPNDTRYQLQLGNSYVQNNRFRDAASLLTKIDEGSLSGSQKQIYHKLLAVSLDKTGQAGAALDALAKAARSNPNDASVQYNYGAAAFNAGRTADAVNALEKAVRLDGRDTTKRRAYVDALMRSGRETRGSGKLGVYAKAADAAKALVAADPSYDNLMKLGEAQLGAKQYTEAVQSFNQAASKKSNEWIPHFYIGQASTARQEYTKAEQALKQALQKSPPAKDRQRVQKQLGFVYEKQKRYDEAIDFYNQAGDAAGAQRARENRDINAHNREAEAEQREYEELKAAEERLKKELEELGTEPPRF
ncbi:MAG: tetratricopeptide repeat protein [Acidobacteriota bacterium]|nr:tetratricopeptide repeat protein [Acidobacteriota bacterium]